MPPKAACVGNDRKGLGILSVEWAKDLRGLDYRGLQVLQAERLDLRDIHACRDKSQPL